jgi:AcrR family transcriptional regulator
VAPGGANTKRRTKRSTAAVRELILTAALELFREKGYEATTTREIAAKAGVIEPLIFRHFGNKAGVFDAAVSAPFSILIDEYVEAWEREPSPADPDQRIATFLEQSYELARQNKRLLLDAVAQRQAGASPEEDVLDHIGRAFRRIERIAVIPVDYPGMDPPATVAAIGGILFGAALLDDMFYPRGTRRPSRARIVAEITGTVLDGIERPARPEASPRPRKRVNA